MAGSKTGVIGPKKQQEYVEQAKRMHTDCIYVELFISTKPKKGPTSEHLGTSSQALGLVNNTSSLTTSAEALPLILYWPWRWNTTVWLGLLCQTALASLT